jgi:sugar phosphate isomerase/epimerase
MKTIKGPAILLAQFAGDAPPFNTLKGMAGWAAALGYKGIQIPTWDGRLFDLTKASSSKTYCDEVKGMLAEHGLQVTELSTHLQGQLVAVNPVYDSGFDAFAVLEVRGNPKARTEWAIGQVKMGANACRNLGIDTMVSFTGAFAWPFLYPFPQRPPGLIETSFDELAKRWKPIFDHCDGQGVDVGFELHPSEDVFDGVTFEMFLERAGNHPRCGINYDPSHFVLQCLDYLEFIDIYHERIFAFHVKDAEFNPTGRQGVYSGFQPWLNRASRFRSLGDGQVDFKGIFAKLAQYDYDGWAVLEWECALKHPEDGAREGAPFIRDHIIRVTEKAFDDFAATGIDLAGNKKLLGIA